MDVNLKPFLGSKTSKISYKEPGFIDLNQTRSNLLTLLAKLRSYFVSSEFQTRLTTLNSFTHQAIKQNIHDTLNILIETYVSHSTQEKIEEGLNALSKTSFTEEDRNNITGFYQKLQTNILDPISNILEFLHTAESAGQILEGDIESAEAKARKILLAIIYNIQLTKQRPLNTFAKYCHINHQNLLNALTRESQPLSQNDIVEATDFSMDKFKNDYLTSNEEVERVAQLFDQAATTKSARELLDALKAAITAEFNVESGLTDANIKLDYIHDINREELKIALKRSLEALLRDQVEEKSTTLLHTLETHLKEIRDEFSKLKDYFQARDESKTHQKLIDGSYEHDLVETNNSDVNKGLHTIKIYEDLMVEIFSNLSQLEKANGKYSETNEHISREVKKLFSELLENARKSLNLNTPLGAFKEDILLDQTPFLNSLHELIEKVNPDPSKLTEKINVNVVHEKLGLTAKEIGDENILKNLDFSIEAFATYKQEPTPFYFYNVASQVVILQVLDLANNNARIFCERKEELGNSNIQKVHLIVHQDLKRVLELLVECHNIKTNKSHNITDSTIRNIVLTLALFIIDNYVGENDNVNEVVIEKRHIQEFIASQKVEKVRKTPTEKPQIQEQAPEEAVPQVEETQPEKTETIQEEQPAEEPVKTEQVEESKEVEQEVANEINQAEENPVPSEEAGNVEDTGETKETQQDTTVSNAGDQTQETIKPEEIPEESKTEEPQTEDTSAKNAGDEDQEEAGKEEPQAGNKEGGQAAGGASKKKKNKKKR